MTLLWTWFSVALDWYTPDRVIALATTAYVTVTTIMLFAIRAQAKAAQTSADSLKALERPWILVRPIENNDEIPRLNDEGEWEKPEFMPGTGPTGYENRPAILFTSEELRKGDSRVPLRFSIRNYGKSPGHMVYHWAKLAIIDTQDAMPKIPDYLAKLPSFDAPDTRLMEPRRAFKNYIEITLKDFMQMWERNKFLYLYGYITYLDVWGNPHKTGFSFYYHIPGPFDRNSRAFYPEPQSYNYET